MDTFTKRSEADRNHSEACRNTCNEASEEIRSESCKSNHGECGGVAPAAVSKNVHGGTGIQNQDEIGMQTHGDCTEDTLDEISKEIRCNINLETQDEISKEVGDESIRKAYHEIELDPHNGTSTETLGGVWVVVHGGTKVGNQDGIDKESPGKAINEKHKERANETHDEDKEQGCVLVAVSYSSCGGNRENLARLDSSGMIFVPSSFLGSLKPETISLPLCIKVSSKNSPDKFTHCGILEYRAPVGKVVLPGWVMRRLAIAEGDMVCLEPAAVPMATKVLIESLSPIVHVFKKRRDVLYLVNRSYDFLTLNDVISVKYGEHYFDLVVRELKPETAVCLLDHGVMEITSIWKIVKGIHEPAFQVPKPGYNGKQQQSHSTPKVPTPIKIVRLAPEHRPIPCGPCETVEVVDWGIAFIPQQNYSRTSTEPQQESNFNAQPQANGGSTSESEATQRITNSTVEMNTEPAQELPSLPDRESPSSLERESPSLQDKELPSIAEVIGQSLSMYIDD